MTHRVLGAALGALVLVTAACGAGAEDTAQPEPVAEASTEAADQPTTSAPATSAPATSAPATSDEPTVLIGTVGKPEDPEAFEITLTDESGEPVTEIPAGDYVVQVSDPAASHNFHLTGGSVDESTTVPEQVETTFTVTLEPGEYTYTCDPHPSMTGTFTVT